MVNMFEKYDDDSPDSLVSILLTRLKLDTSTDGCTDGITEAFTT